MSEKMRQKMDLKRDKAERARYLMVVPLEVGKGSTKRMGWCFSDAANIKTPSEATLSITVDTEKWWTTSGQWWYLNLLTLESDKPFATIVKVRRCERIYGKGENKFIENIVLGCLENPDDREIETMIAYAHNYASEVKKYMESNRKYIPPSFLDSPQNHAHAPSRSPEDGGSPPVRKHTPKPVWGGRKSGGDV
jgi:hypothetical protein